MKLKDILLEHKESILRSWFDRIIETYPSESREILKRDENQFANPMGYTISTSIKAIFDELIKEKDDPEKLSLLLDYLIKIRAIQDFTPSEAISFVYLLKKVIMEKLKNVSCSDRVLEEWFIYETRIDHLAVLSFDIYMRCREKLYEIRSSELKKNTFRLLQKANRMG